MTRLRLFLPLLAVPPSPALAQTVEAGAVAEPPGADVTADNRPTMNVAVPNREPGCARAITTDEIVVCGRREDTTYRLDPRLMEAQRRMAGGRDAPPAAERLLVSCSDTSARGCPGQGAVSVSGGALKLMKTLAAAVTGQDWKEPLRPKEQDEYQAYRSLPPPADPSADPAP